MEAILTEALENPKTDLCSQELADKLDGADPLRRFRSQFKIPKTHEKAQYRTAGSPSLYLCGNSLGLQPVRTAGYVNEELERWSELGVEGHFLGQRPWAEIEDSVTETSAAIVGAQRNEVAVMNSLTVNLHLLMVPFYRPTPTRFRILIEAHAFPSDTYAVKSQLAVHGHNPDIDPSAFITVKPRPGEELIRHEDILAAIAEAGDSLALVLWPGIQYYTGQAFDLQAICDATHAVGALFGLDLAHAVGNIPLSLHDWGVDFAAWCSYKYLNSGPGGIAGAFVHDKYKEESFASRPYFAGWWGHRRFDRFKMGDNFQPHDELTAARLQLSNPAVLTTAALRGSLDTFKEASFLARGKDMMAEGEAREGGKGEEAAAWRTVDRDFMAPLRQKSLALTGFLEALLVTECGAAVGPGALNPSLKERIRINSKQVAKRGAAGDDGEEEGESKTMETDESIKKTESSDGKTGSGDGDEDDADEGEGSSGKAKAGAGALAHEAEGKAGAAEDGERSGRKKQEQEQPPITILTPSDPSQRGCQLSLVFKRPVKEVHKILQREGVICDTREPHVMRVAPVPLYTSFSDVLEFVTTLKMAFAELE